MSTEIRKSPIHNGETRRKAAAWDWIVRLGAAGVWPLTLALFIYVLSHERTHESIRSFMEHGDRFSKEDGLLLERSLKEWSEGRYPPAWLREDLNEIKADMKAMRRDIDTIKAQK